MPSAEILSFYHWFQSHNGYIDTSSMDIVPLPPSEGGRGAIALVDIPENHTLFSVPRSLVFTVRTSELPPKFGTAAWNHFGLHQGWSGLILCLMWEAARGSESKWAPYFDMMPARFDTPMFWNDEDMAELQGTSVVDKLGKEQAERDYFEKIVPAIESRPDLFPTETLSTLYSLEAYHITGTRVLSRSFTLSKEEVEDDDESEQPEKAEEKSVAPEIQSPEIVAVEDAGNTSLGSAMDVDEPSSGNQPADEASHDDENEDEQGDEGGVSDSESESEENSSPEVAMVPMADILNARYKTDNVKLFHERDSLRMVSTRLIKAGEQIWNTYGDLPNADLLRGFGHVDYMPLPYAPGEYGNPGDVFELRADLIVQCALDFLNEERSGESAEKLTADDMAERIDWWLEEGGDDIFFIEHPSNPTDVHPNSKTKECQNPDDPAGFFTTSLSIVLLSFMQLILLSPPDFLKAKAKGRPPKPKPSTALLRVLLASLQRRGAQYPTTLEADEEMVRETPLAGMSLNKRHAVIVRMGEKRVLRDLRRYVEGILEGVERREREERERERERKDEVASKKPQSKAEKRKAERAEGGGRKRRK